MPTRRELLRSTLPAAAFAAAGSGLGFDALVAAATPVDSLDAPGLEKVVPDLNLDGVPFSDVLDFLADTNKLNLDVRWPALEAAGVNQKEPITMRLRQVPLGKVLDLVLTAGGAGKVRLGHVEDRGVITISTRDDINKSFPNAAVGSATVAAGAGYFAMSNFYADGEWKLPKLPYDYDALEPHIDARTMELHHSKHHAAYVANLNKALKAMKDLPDDATAGAIESLQRDISFNLGGHTLHSMFWGTLGKGVNGKMGGEPEGKLLDAINAQFGSFDKFKSYFSKIATSLKGSGWAILAYSPVSQSLVTYALKDQDSTHAPGTMPILGVDVWEHAYYLKYQNDRAAYVKAWWETINWEAVNQLMSVHAPH